MHLPPLSHRAIKVAASERCKEGIITFKHCRNDVEELNPEPGTITTERMSTEEGEEGEAGEAGGLRDLLPPAPATFCLIFSNIDSNNCVPVIR